MNGLVLSLFIVLSLFVLDLSGNKIDKVVVYEKIDRVGSVQSGGDGE